ncbi:hypothetical protein FD755_019343 [Muntiacus reevesi]|uniref:Uncharacterized protein n=1 Tax=Muntiacus reevesi TaxID=9886 RepID=A0A5N3X870_MUNRE|nr:hypothetical protein FD755_019343 [Muntiacus reevesi]
MGSVEQGFLETTPTPNPTPTEDEKTESNQEVANPEHYIKHPLQNRWALWFLKTDKSKTWQLSSNLMPGCDYSLFKDETLLCLIGESFDDYSDDVCGVIVNVRAKAIWATECENREAATHIGKTVIGYQSHADTATQSGSATKNRFVV